MPFFDPLPPVEPEPQDVAERVWIPPRWDRASEGGIRIGVLFSNGQRSAVGGAGAAGVATDEQGVPTEPIITAGGGGGSGGNFRWEHWIFPLPPPGPLAVFAEWPDAGIDEASVVISGEMVRDAAQRSVVLWS